MYLFRSRLHFIHLLIFSACLELNMMRILLKNSPSFIFIFLQIQYTLHRGSDHSFLLLGMSFCLPLFYDRSDYISLYLHIYLLEGLVVCFVAFIDAVGDLFIYLSKFQEIINNIMEHIINPGKQHILDLIMVLNQVFLFSYQNKKSLLSIKLKCIQSGTKAFHSIEQWR